MLAWWVLRSRELRAPDVRVWISPTWILPGIYQFYIELKNSITRQCTTVCTRYNYTPSWCRILHNHARPSWWRAAVGAWVEGFPTISSWRALLCVASTAVRGPQASQHLFPSQSLQCMILSQISQMFSSKPKVYNSSPQMFWKCLSFRIISTDFARFSIKAVFLTFGQIPTEIVKFYYIPCMAISA